jgi:hypothetical protein
MSGQFAWLFEATVVQVVLLGNGEVLDSSTLGSLEEAIEWALASLGRVCLDPDYHPAKILRFRLHDLASAAVTGSRWHVRRGGLEVRLEGC